MTAIEEPDVQVTRDGVTVTTRLGTSLAGRYDFAIEQGRTFSLRLTWENEQQGVIDLTAYTARLKVKEHWDSAATLISLTQADGIALAATVPSITISRTAAQTAAYTGWLRAVYDLELVSAAGVVTRLLQGMVTLRREVTT